MDNIRVAIRVRPLIQREVSRDAESYWNVEDNTIFQVENGVPVPSNIINPTAFTFDNVYKGTDSTEEIYNAFAKPVVFKAMEGVNGTIFAYGQTGTGKTYTMMGLPTNSGIIPRSINDVFDLVNMAPDREFLIRVSYMEIYNEVITDLLKIDGANLKVRNNEKNEVFVENLSEVPIASADQAFHHLQVGERQRRFGETNMNEKSSRSHTIFRVIIESRLTAKNSEDQCENNAVTVSQLNLVDLAGSERASQTGAQGTRLKESGYINKSLLTLGTVISKLSSAGDERSFVPYRDSKLTRILQNSLGGNAMTSVIATVTPAVAEETLSTLKFASRAKTIKNKPKVNEVVDGDTMIKRYRKEINMLKRQITEIQTTTGINHLKMENEKMEQMLEEYERKRREQTEKISSLQNMIITAENFRWNKVTKPARRETWCPGNLKRSLARAQDSAVQGFRLAHLSSGSESDDEGQEMSIKKSFYDDKSDFIRDLEKEERKSLEEFKRKRSGSASRTSPNLKYRRSYQSALRVEPKRDQGCQTEKESIFTAQAPDPAMLETLQKYKDESTLMAAEIEKLQSKIWDLEENNEELVEKNEKLNILIEASEKEKNDAVEAEHLRMLAEMESLKTKLVTVQESHDSVVTLNEQLNEQLKSLEMKQEILEQGQLSAVNSPRFTNISTRRRVRSLSPGTSLTPLKSIKLNIEENIPKQLEHLACQTKVVSSPSPSKSELKANLSLANFEYMEKDLEFDELKSKLEEAVVNIQERDELIEEIKDQIRIITEKSEDDKKLLTDQNDLLVENDFKLQEAQKKIKVFIEELDNVKEECLSLSESKLESENMLSDVMKELDQVNAQLEKMKTSSTEGNVLENSKVGNEEEKSPTIETINNLQAQISKFEEEKFDLEKEFENIILEKVGLENNLENKDEIINQLTEENAKTKETINNLQAQRSKSEGSILDLEQKLEKIRLEKAELESNIEIKEKIITALQDKSDDGEALTKETIDNLKAQISKFEESRFDLEKELEQLKLEKAEFETSIRNKDIIISELTDNNEEGEALTKEKIDNLKAQISKFEESRFDLEKELEQLKLEKAEFETSIRNKDIIISELKDQNDEGEALTKETIDNLKAQISKFEESRFDLEKELEQLKLENAELETNIRNKDTVISELKGDCENLSSFNQTAEGCEINDSTLHEDKKEIIEELRTERQELKKTIDDRDREIAELKDEHNKELDSSRSYIKELKTDNLNLDEMKNVLQQQLDTAMQYKTEMELCIAEKEIKINDIQVLGSDMTTSTCEKLESLKNAVSELEENKRQLEEALDIVKKEKSELEKSLADKNEVIKELQDEESGKITLSPDDFESLKVAVCKLEESKIELQHELDSVKKANEELEIRLQSKEKLIEDTKDSEDITSNTDELETSKHVVLKLEKHNCEIEETVNKDEEALEKGIEVKEKVAGELIGTENEQINSSFEKHEELHKRIDQLEEEKAELEQELDSIKKDKTELEECIEDKEKFVEEMQANVSSGEATIKMAELELKIVELEVINEELQEKLNDKGSPLEERETLMEQIKVLEKEVELLTVKAEMSTTAESECRTDIKQLEEKNFKLNKHLTLLSDDLQSAEDENMNLIEQISVLKQSLAEIEHNKDSPLQEKDLENIKNEHQMKIECFQREVDDLRFVSVQKDEDIARLSNDLESQLADNESLNKAITQLKGVLEDNKTQIDSLLKDVSEQNKRPDDYMKELMKLENVIKEKEMVIAKMEDEKRNFVEQEKELLEKIEQSEMCYQELCQIKELHKNQTEAIYEEKRKQERTIAEMQNKIDEYEVILQSTGKERQQLCSEISEINLKIQEKDQEIDAIAEKYRLVKDESSNALSEIKALKHEKDELTARCAILEQNSQHETEIKEQLEAQKNELERLIKENLTYKDEIAKLEKNIDDDDAEMEQLVNTIQENEKQISQLKVLNASDNELRATISSLKDKLDKEQRDIARLNDTCRKQKSELEHLQNENRDNTTSNKLADKKIAELESAVHKYESLYRECKTAERTSREEAQTLILKVGQLSRQVEAKSRDNAEQMHTIRKLEEERQKSLSENNDLNRQSKNRVSNSDGTENIINSNAKKEIEVCKLALEKAKKENIQFQAEIARLQNENEKIGTEADEEMQTLLEEMHRQQEERRKEEKRFKEQIQNLQNKLTDNEELIRVKEELEIKRKDRFDEISNNDLNRQSKNRVSNSDDTENVIYSNAKKEIEVCKLALEKAKKENIQFQAEISRLQNENEKTVTETDEEVQTLLEEMHRQQEERRKEEKLLKEQIQNLQNKLTDNEELIRVKEELETTRKDRFDKICNSVRLEKENQRLIKELEDSQKARIANEQYQENRVASLKNELKRLREDIGSSSSQNNEGVKARGVIETTAVFSLKLEKANLEREGKRLKQALEDIKKKNQHLSLEKCDFESKYNSLKNECYRLKRGLRGYSQDAGTQTLKEQCFNTEKPKGTNSKASENDRGFLAPDLYPFKEEKEDPAQCTQQ